ncbi:hypothetical protein KY289_030536 [Solanum tuberosum]|nr:hypothetical protein KY289_030536 [Solanum tuberosum]
MSNQLRTKLGCKGIEHAKSNVRGTHEHGYAGLNVYRYMLEVANPGSKTALLLDENGRFKHPSIRKMVSTIYPASHYGCCMRHLGKNIQNNFHNSKAAESLERIGFHTWSRAFCPGNRYNIMTSNIAESVNSMFDVEREFPIVALFDEINRRFALLFHQRRMELVNSANRFVPSIEKDISNVTGHGDVATVDLQRRTCTCRILDLDKIPCPHAMPALRVHYGADFGNQIYEYSSPYYSVEKYIMAYCEEIHPVPPEDSWIVPLDVIEREIPPPYVDQSKPERRR